MFIQGVYLHGKLTTNEFDKGTPFRVYYTIGWILPFFLVIIHAIVKETYHPVYCWKDYSERSAIWILLGSMIFALLAHLVFLINIMRILLTKVQRPNSFSDSVQLRRAVKATLILFPLLGIDNLLFLYNPGGKYNKYFGILVSILYCFVSKDVRAAIHRVYQRFAIRRSANASMRISHSPWSSVMRHSTITSQPRIHFRTKLKREYQASEEMSGTRMTCRCTSPGLVMVHEILGHGETPTPQSPFSDGNGNGISLNNPVLLQEKVGQGNRYSVSLPMSELERN